MRTEPPGRILWPNIFAFILLISAMVLLLTHCSEIKGFLGNMRSIGPGHTADEQTLGLIAFGFICACFVAIVKILTNQK